MVVKVFSTQLATIVIRKEEIEEQINLENSEQKEIPNHWFHPKAKRDPSEVR